MLGFRVTAWAYVVSVEVILCVPVVIGFVVFVCLAI